MFSRAVRPQDSAARTGASCTARRRIDAPQVPMNFYFASMKARLISLNSLFSFCM